MNTAVRTTNQQKIDRFAQLFSEGIDAWVKAGELLVEMLDESPTACADLAEQNPQLTPEVLAKFEMLGRKTLRPELLFTSCAGFNRLKRLPYSAQKRYLEEPIPVIISTDHGTDQFLVKARDMTPDQANQVFSGTRIRSKGEQTAYLIQRNSDRVSRDVCNWKIKGGKVEFKTGTTLSTREVASILSQMTR